MSQVYWDNGFAEGPLYAPNPWDTAYIAGTQIPGLVEVQAGQNRKIDIKSAPGIGGSTITIVGFEPSRVDIKITVWTAEQWKALQDLLAVVWPGKAPVKTFDISHPSLSLIGIKSVIVTGITPFVQGQVKQSKTVTLHCLQWGKTKRGVTTPKASESAPKVNQAFGTNTVQTQDGKIVTVNPANGAKSNPSKTDAGP